MDKIIKKYFSSKNIAVVGTSNDTNKYGYKVFHLISHKDYNIFPVNPKIKEIDKIKVYPSIESIEQDIDAVSIIIPPQNAEKVLEEISSKKIKIVWFQPGAESFKLIRFCNTHNIDVIYHKCVLVEIENLSYFQ